jgi:hypothetical protein
MSVRVSRWTIPDTADVPRLVLFLIASIVASAPPTVLGGRVELQQVIEAMQPVTDRPRERTGHPIRPGRDVPSVPEGDGLRRWDFRR